VIQAVGKTLDVDSVEIAQDSPAVLDSVFAG
jgi:hypothetical protein